MCAPHAYIPAWLGSTCTHCPLAPPQTHPPPATRHHPTPHTRTHLHAGVCHAQAGGAAYAGQVGGAEVAHQLRGDDGGGAVPPLLPPRRCREAQVGLHLVITERALVVLAAGAAEVVCVLWGFDWGWVVSAGVGLWRGYAGSAAAGTQQGTCERMCVAQDARATHTRVLVGRYERHRRQRLNGARWGEWVSTLLEGSRETHAGRPGPLLPAAPGTSVAAGLPTYPPFDRVRPRRPGRGSS